MDGISIIVCTFNRKTLLDKFVRSFIDQYNIGSNSELIIIDNNSSDDTGLYRNNSHDQKIIRYYLELKQGLSYARNRGAQEAKYNNLIFCDDDSFLPKDYLLNLQYNLKKYDVDLYGGPCIPDYVDEKPSWFPCALEERIKSKNTILSNHITLSGSNFGIKKEILNELGGFNVAYGMKGNKPGMLEERILIEEYRRLKYAKPILYDVGSMVFHYTPKSRFKFHFQIKRAIDSEKCIVKYYKSKGLRSNISYLTTSFLKTLVQFKKMFKSKSQQDLYLASTRFVASLSYLYYVLFYSFYPANIREFNNGSIVIISEKVSSKEFEKYKVLLEENYLKNRRVAYVYAWGMTRDEVYDAIRALNIRNYDEILLNNFKYRKQISSIKLDYPLITTKFVFRGSIKTLNNMGTYIKTTLLFDSIIII